ncbi:hypothetical protein Tsubulata_043127 [Turnera subulata]|uniref:phosphoglycerate mutase (2,3-diphosphoglycerate-dependent) n=1 Tax=Turnera subulata TaxID=218843 RepID=A0A9Q0JR74_9ROSI|nr:hypothetical protein Tsubulata_043127 [Turnera subulata]
MASAVFNQAIGSLQSPQHPHELKSRHELGSPFVRMVSKGLKVDIGLSRRLSCGPGERKFCVIQASASDTSLVDPVLSPAISSTDEPRKKSSEASLILIRHGESLWNEKNLFTGCVDVPLTKKGVEEAIEAGKRISNIPVDMIFTSSLIRAQMTAMLAMTEHRRRKGLNKQETADRYGKEKVHEWRRSYDIPPPNGESLEMCAQRAVAYFKDHIEPQLQAGKNVMIAAHGNSLRSIIMYLDKLTSQEVISLELSTGIPMLYIFKGGKFIRRGSPVAPTEAGVYAYTRTLAQYRQKLDDMLH